MPGITVGYVDAYYQYYEHPKLVEACDVILANCYPFWEGYNIAQATNYLNHMYQVTNAAAKGKPVIITETGWPNAGESSGQAVPSPLNCMQYFVNSQKWAKAQNIPLFHFSSFDESWKVKDEGTVGDQWGIWDKHEKLKFQ